MTGARRHERWESGAIALSFMTAGRHDVRPHLLRLLWRETPSAIEPCLSYGADYLIAWCRQSGESIRLDVIEGTDSEAIALKARTKKRRNLNSWQKATIAAEAEELLASIAEAAKAKQLATLKQNADDTVTQKFVERPEDNRSEKETSH